MPSLELAKRMRVIPIHAHIRYQLMNRIKPSQNANIFPRKDLGIHSACSSVLDGLYFYSYAVILKVSMHTLFTAHPDSLGVCFFCRDLPADLDREDLMVMKAEM